MEPVNQEALCESLFWKNSEDLQENIFDENLFWIILPAIRPAIAIHLKDSVKSIFLKTILSEIKETVKLQVSNDKPGWKINAGILLGSIALLSRAYKT